MAKANNDAKIEFIVELLAKGGERRDILAKFGEKWQDSDRTFDRLLKSASEINTERNKAKEAIRGTILSDELKNEIQAEIATEAEIDLILSRIVTGGIEIRQYIKGEAIIRDTEPMEIIAAADKLYKRKGSYAAEKKDVRVSKDIDGFIVDD